MCSSDLQTGQLLESGHSLWPHVINKKKRKTQKIKISTQTLQLQGKAKAPTGAWSSQAAKWASKTCCLTGPQKPGMFLHPKTEPKSSGQAMLDCTPPEPRQKETRWNISEYKCLLSSTKMGPWPNLREWEHSGPAGSEGEQRPAGKPPRSILALAKPPKEQRPAGVSRGRLLVPNTQQQLKRGHLHGKLYPMLCFISCDHKY